MTLPGPVRNACSVIAAPAPFEVWRVDLSSEPPAGELEMLDDDERNRAARFAFDGLRRRYRVAHMALRCLLAREAVDPAALRFERGTHGKPRLIGPDDALAFNLSDSDDVALIALAPEGDIGIDVECLRPVGDALELAALHFCRRESAWLADVDATQRDRAFLRVWVTKEACLKAIGSGLSIAAASFDGAIADPADPADPVDPAWRRVSILTPEGVAQVEVTEIDAGADCVAALARWVRA
jgi:4'-phosphopantetheinyl transferase